MQKLTIGKIAEKKLKSGVKLLSDQDIKHDDKKTGLVDLYNQSGKFLARAYLSPQNKGVGWVVAQTKQNMTVDFFVQVFETAKLKRQSYHQDSLTTAYRLFNQDGDDFGGLTIDRYGDYALFSWYNPFVYSLRETIVTAFAQVYPELLGGYEKIRFRELDYETAHLYGQEATSPFTVLENGVRFSVFLDDGLMTGIFLDQHQIRGRLVDGQAAGKSLLNLFSYTAAFSVAAAIGGASQTTSVDLAKRSRELSQAHFKVNGLDLANHKLVVMDVFEYFSYAKRKGLTYDVIVIDPPSFARNKKQTFSVAKDYHRLISQALEILSPQGTIIASTNASNLTLQQFEKQLKKGLGQVSYQISHRDRLPADFAINKNDESSNYLKVVTIEVTQ